MNTENEKNFDELMSRAFGRDNQQFDFNKWQIEHQKEVQIYKSQTQSGRAVQPAQPFILWRIIMKSKITKFAAAAVVVIGLVLFGFTLVEKTSTPAYAVEQTIEANRGLRYIHVKNTPVAGNEPQDVWIEFDRTGEPIRMRLEEGQNETFRIMVWANETIKWYSPSRKKAVIEKDDIKKELQRSKELLDPKFAVQSLYDLQLRGDMDITYETQNPSDGKIKLIATDKRFPANSQRYILLIDPKTKLAIQSEQYILKNGQYQLQRRQLYLENNIPISPDMFELKLPEDVDIVDSSQV